MLCVKTRERRAEARLFAFPSDGRSAGHYTQKEANAKFKIPLFQRDLNFDLNSQLLHGSGMNIACREGFHLRVDRYETRPGHTHKIL